MDRAAFIDRANSIIDKMMEDYKNLTGAQRRRVGVRKGSKADKVLKARAMFAMQRKLMVEDFGMTAAEARKFAAENADIVRLHAGRHVANGPEAFSIQWRKGEAP